MASTLETLVIKLTADARLLEAELDKQVTKAERSGKRIESAFSSGLKFAGAIGIAATGLATGLTAAAQRAATYADEIDQAAIKTRLARSTVQELRYATDQAGGSWAAVESNVRAFTGRIVELERGSDRAAATFAGIGVSAYDTGGKLRATEDVLLDTLHALAGIKNESERAARTVEVFGQSGTDLLPLLSVGASGIEELRSKAHELGLVLDDQSIGALVTYKSEISRVQQQVGALGREFTVALMPILTGGVLPALQSGLDLFRALPQPVKEFGAVTGTAAVGVGALAAALRLVGISAAPLLGPAGMFLVAAAGLGYLVTKFVEADGPLKEHKTHIDELRQAYEEYRGEINVTTDAEREGAIARLQTIRSEMLERVRLLRELANEQKQSVQGFLNSPIGKFLMPGFLNVEASAGYGTLAEIDKLEGTIASLGSDIKALQSGATGFGPGVTPPPPGVTPPPAGTTGSGSGRAVVRTWQMVLDDLDRAGTEAMRRAAFEGTDEAFREAARKRVTLIDNAITEALTTFYGQVSPQELGALAARRARAEHEARIPVAGGTPPDPAGVAALKAQADAIMADTLQANRDARLQELRETLAQNSALRQQALAIMADTSQAQADARAAEEAQRAYIDSLADSGGELGRWLATANNLTATIKSANDETARMGVFADALAKYGSGRAGLAGTSAADRGSLPSLTSRGAAADLARDTVLAVVDAYHAGAATLDDVRVAVEAWTSITPQTVKAINDLTGGILQLAIEAERAKQQAAALAEFESNPGLYGLRDVPGVKDYSAGKAVEARDAWRAPGDITGGVRRSTIITREEAEAALRAQEASADRFASTVVSAGATFASDLVSAIRDGDVGAAFKSALGFGQSVVGAADLGSLPFLGGSIGIGALLSVGLGLIGSLIGAIAGGGNSKASDATNAINRGSVPAINLNFVVNQSNVYNGAPSDPANEQAFARQADALFESIYRRYLEDRFRRLEVRVGIA
ncbi:MAG TPA: hypothetical protein VFN07_01040 [Trueperaceae bacterium]|nr:hypothetical protein [Trueperaceae bacterium]